MCIAIVKPHKIAISKDTLSICFENNPDGCGFMYVDSISRQLIIEKPFFRFEKFWSAYNRVQQSNSSIGDMVIHFRITTSGLDDKKNTHPHRINEHLGFVHNGILDIDQRSQKESDTVTLKKYILQKMPDGFLEYQGIIQMLHSISEGSKLVFLDSKDMQAKIIHEAQGEHTPNGVWYSNTTYRYRYNWARYDEQFYDDFRQPYKTPKPMESVLTDYHPTEEEVQTATEIMKEDQDSQKEVTIHDHQSLSIHDAISMCGTCSAVCLTSIEEYQGTCYECLIEVVEAIEREQVTNGIIVD